MAVHSTSFQFSASYGSVMARKRKTPEPSKAVRESIENGGHIKLAPKELRYEDAWQSLWGVKETETENSDGTVTKSLSGGVNVIGANGSGRTGFQVSLTFDPSTYEPGQLSETIDFMAAARAASKAAWDDLIEDHLDPMGRGLNTLEAAEEESQNYQAQKDVAAKAFAEMVGGPMEEQGRAGEKEKIYQSVQAVFTSFEARYQALAAGTDSWKDADLLTAAMNLRKLSVSIKMDSGRTAGLYTLRELEMTAVGVRGGLNLKA